MRLFCLLVVTASVCAAPDYAMYKEALSNQLMALKAEVAKRPMPTKMERDAQEAEFIVLTHSLDRALAKHEREEMELRRCQEDLTAKYQLVIKDQTRDFSLKISYEQAIKKYDEARAQFNEGAYALALAKHAFIRAKQEREWNKKMWQWHVEARVEMDRLQEELHSIASGS